MAPFDRPDNSKPVQDRAIFTWRTNRKSYNDLSNGASFNDFEQPLTKFSRSRNNLVLNVSQTVEDSVIVTVECE